MLEQSSGVPSLLSVPFSLSASAGCASHVAGCHHAWTAHSGAVKHMVAAMSRLWCAMWCSWKVRSCEGCWETILSQCGRKWWCGSELFCCWLLQCFSVSVDLRHFVLLWALAWRMGICFSSVIVLRAGLLSSEKDRSSDSEKLNGFDL